VSERRHQLHSLLDGISSFPPGLSVTGVALDSRRVCGGDVFVACRGSTNDGHAFIAQAIANGAVAVVAERQVADCSVPLIVVPDSRHTAAIMAARLYHDPSRAVRCVGVTGTNGKTSVAYYLADILNRSGIPTGYGGTLGWAFGRFHCRGGLTTEDAVSLQAKLAEFARLGARRAALEVSSHALDQQRTEAVAFDIAVFTNLTRDHLDYHPSMDAYGAAKARLFRCPSLTHAVVNLDDEFGRRLAADIQRGVELIGYGFGVDAAVRISNVAFRASGIEAQFATPWGTRKLQLPLYGEFSLANVAAAIGAAGAAGADFHAIAAAAERLQPAPGRMQFLRRPGRPVAVVDYAHTPDALAKALSALRRHCAGRIHCVFGCGGDRDPGKRPLMAEAVEAAADSAIVTSDNPRSEDPARIAAAVCGGFSGRIPYVVELDRERAINAALAAAKPGDVVLIAGKGHEDYQEIAGRRLPFDDFDVLQRAMER
jgi:UDP-N-acetylmuramoyl-L-alanyl-D-glutamate--2,6-diaminopimelate ligase